MRVPAGCVGTLSDWESSSHESTITMTDNGVFISYRRGTGSDVARIMQEYLEGQSFDVFLDVDSLGAGHFDEQLLREIESRRIFVLICSPGCLDRCVHEGDWVRRELEYAIQTGRHIVPVTMPQFVWPTGEAMPRAVTELQRHNAFEYSHSHWKLIKPKLVEMLRAERERVKVEQASATVLSEVAPAQATSPQPCTPQLWCEVIAELPDPSVVTDDEGRARMLATGLPWKVRDKKTGIVMLLCPPGDFMMGSPVSEVDRFDDETQHRRTIVKAYYLGETEVTQEQWRRVMGANPSHFEGASTPVEQVSWDDCQRFCNRVGLRLPSEAEWEYACRAGTTTAYSFGDTVTKRQVCFEGMNPVACGSLPANPWGFHEMHGNVWEWVTDTYAEYPKEVGGQEAVEGNALSYRVLRGGSWSDYAYYVRSSYRDDSTPVITYSVIGFRVARDPF